jgi:putative spermidine/putrescine transport system substrate-binding protein
MYGSSSRRLLRGAAALAVTAGLTVSSGLVPAHPVTAASQSTIYFTSLGDVNIEDLYRNTLIPDFEKAYPQYTVKFTDILHGTNSQSLVIDNITAAMNAGKKSIKLDVFEDTPLNYTYPTGKTYKDYFLPLSVSDIPNIAKIDPAVENEAAGYGVAYRSSAVTLAYNSKEVMSPPKTFNDLIAWIKANPGKFTYCRPDEGGSGGNFVQAAIRSVMNPADYKALAQPHYNPALEKDWPKAWALLKSIEPDLYQHGYHPDGNIPVLNLLAKGVITVATAWSDQGLSALDKGTLPSYIKLTQINPPFPGGPSFMSVPKLAQDPAGAKVFLNFVLSPVEQGKIATAIEGFPGIDFKYISPAVVKHFGSIATGYDPVAPIAQYGDDINRLWKQNVPNS